MTTVFFFCLIATTVIYNSSTQIFHQQIHDYVLCNKFYYKISKVKKFYNIFIGPIFLAVKVSFIFEGGIFEKPLGPDSHFIHLFCASYFLLKSEECSRGMFRCKSITHLFPYSLRRTFPSNLQYGSPSSLVIGL